MSFLYGDSSASKLEINYVAFLRDALDLMVAILCAEDRVKQGDVHREQKKAAAEDELTELMALGSDLTERLTKAAELKSANTRTAADRIRNSTSQAVQDAAAAIRVWLESAHAELAGNRQREREKMLKALEAFLLKHDLPETTFHHSIRFIPGGARVEISGHAACGMDWVMSADPSRDPIFGGPIRVDRFSDNLEIQVPEFGGMMKKTLKFRSHKLSGKWVSELVVTPKEGSFKLRSALDDNNDGFDVTISGRKVSVVRHSKDGNEPFDPGDEDSQKLIKLYRDLSNATAKMNCQRLALLSATLDEKSLPAHEDPVVLCKRLIDSMAPTVKEIADHSMSGEELVLKRVLAEDRREEIFCSKNDLRKKILPAPETSHQMFAPLGLVPTPGLRAGPSVPPPDGVALLDRRPNSTRPPETRT